MRNDIDEETLEIVHSFVAECREIIQESEPLLIELEGNETSQSADAIAMIFRSFHSMKGSAGYLQFQTMEQVTHASETVLSMVQEGSLSLSGELIDLLFQALDLLSKRLNTIEQTLADEGDEAAAQALIARIQELSPAAPQEADAPAEEDLHEAISALESLLLDLLPDTCDADALRQVADAFTSIARQSRLNESSQAAALARAAAELLERLLEGERQISSEQINHLLLACDTLQETLDTLQESDELTGLTDTIRQLTDAPAAQDAPVIAPTSAAGPPPPQSTKKREYLRIDVSKLDQLMDLVGELIIAGTSVTHHPDVLNLQLASFQKASLQLDRVTRSLQDIAMSVRMVPLEPVFRRMLRLVRDVSQKQSKSALLTIAGEDTEVDKTVVEIIADPLVHILRNAVDHGIEPAEERLAAGKPAEGRIRLSARHHGGEIWITIEDDGRGLSRERILKRALERGLLAADRPTPPDQELFKMIFEPGFSTAEAVTDISGRGVGMDVVKRNIDRVNGRIDIQTTLGAGTTITMRIPLTLAIIEGMLVRIQDVSFTIPLLSIRESLVAREDDITRLPSGQELLLSRGRLIPILRINNFYGLSDERRALSEGILVVVEDGEAVFALLVDELIGQRQTVIKALSGYLGPTRGLSGCTVLGNGDISLILDISKLSQAALGAA